MEQTYNCPNCQALVAYGQNTCNTCGITLDWGFAQQTILPQQDTNQQHMWDQQVYECPNCLAPVAYGQDTCNNCGIVLNWGVAQQTPDQGKHKYTKQKARGKLAATLKKKRLSPILIAVASLVFVAIVAGGIAFALKGDSQSSTIPSDEQATTSTATVYKKPPAIKLFKAEPATITQGQKTTLTWDISEAMSVTIEPGFGTVSSSGTKMVSPDKNTTYYLTATNNAGPVKASIIVTVKEPDEPAITSFSVSPGNISAGQFATLQWSVARSTYVSIDQGIGVVMASGKQPVNPTTSTTYTITATNGYGSVTKSVTLTVASSKVPVISSFTANPATTGASGESTLTWDVSGATSISIDPGVGSVLATGSTIVSPTETTTYNLTARNSAGSVTKSATITVASNLPVITGFSAGSNNIPSGSSVILQWNITGATSASIDQGIGTISETSGTLTITPARTTTYILTATNSYGSVTKSVILAVVSTSPPVINSFTANPSSITAGGSVTLSWNIDSATSASIDHNVGDLSVYFPSQSVDVSPDVTTTYTLTATNVNGSVTSSVEVIVTASP